MSPSDEFALMEKFAESSLGTLTATFLFVSFAALILHHSSRFRRYRRRLVKQLAEGTHFRPTSRSFHRVISAIYDRSDEAINALQSAKRLDVTRTPIRSHPRERPRLSLFRVRFNILFWSLFAAGVLAIYFRWQPDVIFGDKGLFTTVISRIDATLWRDNAALREAFDRSNEVGQLVSIPRDVVFRLILFFLIPIITFFLPGMVWKNVVYLYRLIYSNVWFPILRRTYYPGLGNLTSWLLTRRLKSAAYGTINPKLVLGVAPTTGVWHKKYRAFGRWNPLPPSLSDDLHDYADSHAAATVSNLREALGLVHMGMTSASAISELSRTLTGGELIHTSYFTRPKSRKLVIFCMLRTAKKKIPGYFRDDEDYETIVDAYERIAPESRR